VHVSRNIKDVDVPEYVKNMMRGLVCVEHDDFEGALVSISLEGGKAGSGA
jgi:hypothetical protein